MFVVDDAHREECAVRVALNDRAADSRPPLAERLLCRGPGQMMVLREPAFPGVQFNEFRSADALSLASHELNQRRRTVAADAPAKILLKGYITVFLTFDGAAELNDRVGDQSVVGPARFSFKTKDFREAFTELFVPLEYFHLRAPFLATPSASKLSTLVGPSAAGGLCGPTELSSTKLEARSEARESFGRRLSFASAKAV